MANELRQEIGGGALAGSEMILGNSHARQDSLPALGEVNSLVTDIK